MIPNLKSKLNSIRKTEAQAATADGISSVCRLRETLYTHDEPIFGEQRRLARGITVETLERLCLTALPAGIELRDAVFMDTETTGLSGGAGTVAFLVGLGRFTEKGFLVSQYWMEDYTQEADMLVKIQGILLTSSFVVTYNGKTFDLPLLETRMIMNRLRMRSLPHLDLLHAARRLVKRRLQSCTLGDVEEGLLGIHREDDVRGVLIPEMYFRYLKDRDEKPLEGIFNHNAQDIATMPVLLYRLCDILQHPELSEPEDCYSCGVLMERLGDRESAESAYAGLWQESPDAAVRLSLLYKRSGRIDEACRIWQYMEEKGWGGTFPYVEIAKVQEHSRKDYEGAIRQVETCLAHMRAIGIGSRSAEEPLRYRLRRLQEKVQRRSK